MMQMWYRSGSTHLHHTQGRSAERQKGGFMDDNQQNSLPAEHLTAGQSFVKSIRPAGCVLFIVVAVLVAAVCLTAGRDPIPNYHPPEPASYAGDPSALARVLEEQVFPELPDYDMTAAVTGDTVTVTIDDAHFVVGRAAILRYFDEQFLTFERGQ